MKFETIEDFIKDSNEWMYSLGYSLQLLCNNRTKNIYSRIDNSQNLYPSIEINYCNGEPKVEITNTSGFKYCNVLSSGSIQYRHPDIIKFIAYQTFCANLVNGNIFANSFSEAVEEQLKCY